MYTREALATLKRTDEWDPCHGLKLKYVNPVTGSYAVPTIGAFIQLLPNGFATIRYRSTDATLFVPIEGTGVTRIGDKTFEWKAKDVIVAPSWQWITHEAKDEAVIFSCSDRPVQEILGLFREERRARDDVFMIEYIFPHSPVSSAAILGEARRFPVHRIYCVGRKCSSRSRDGKGPGPRTSILFLQNQLTRLLTTMPPSHIHR